MVIASFFIFNIRKHLKKLNKNLRNSNKPDIGSLNIAEPKVKKCIQLMDDKEFKGNNRTIEFNKKLITINSNKKFENELKSDFTIDFKNQANTTSIDILQNKSKSIIII